MSLPESAVPLAHAETEPTVCGYRNHATFVVAMRLSNSSAAYAAEVRALVPTDGEYIRMRLADALRERIELECAPVPHGTLPDLGHDLLSYALACVDWDELAEEWLEVARERGVSA
jgi:hypothetical protein